jgi:ApaG protein
MSTDPIKTQPENSDSDIRVESKCWYLPEQSNPEERRFVFSYTMSIHNDGAKPAQLLTRHWLITDADGKVQEVQGDGVIGDQPEIKPGANHTYTSGAIIETPVGTMEGKYGMTNTDGQQFDTPIPVFRLAIPGILN